MIAHKRDISVYGLIRSGWSSRARGLSWFIDARRQMMKLLWRRKVRDGVGKSKEAHEGR